MRSLATVRAALNPKQRQITYALIDGLGAGSAGVPGGLGQLKVFLTVERSSGKVYDHAHRDQASAEGHEIQPVPVVFFKER